MIVTGSSSTLGMARAGITGVALSSAFLFLVAATPARAHDPPPSTSVSGGPQSPSPGWVGGGAITVSLEAEPSIVPHGTLECTVTGPSYSWSIVPNSLVFTGSTVPVTPPTVSITPTGGNGATLTATFTDPLSAGVWHVDVTCDTAYTFNCNGTTSSFTETGTPTTVNLQAQAIVISGSPVIQLKDTVMQHLFPEVYTAELLGATQDLTTVLTNPDGRLRFNGETLTALSFSLSCSGASYAFAVYGIAGSEQLNDAVILATGGGQTVAVSVTVYWFDMAYVNTAAVGTYEVDPNNPSLTAEAGDVFWTPGYRAISLTGYAHVEPSGVCGTNLQTDIAIEQTIATLNTISYWTLDPDPDLVQVTGELDGPTEFPVANSAVAIQVMSNCDDVCAGDTPPLYDYSGGSPICGGWVTSYDMPWCVFPHSVTFPLYNSEMQQVAIVPYDSLDMGLEGSFSDWVSAYNTDVHLTAPLAEAGWVLDVSSASGGNLQAKGATPPSASPPAGPPVESGVICNDGFALMPPTQDTSDMTSITVYPDGWGGGGQL